MLYAILCYNEEDVVGSWSREEDDAVMGRLAVVHERLARQGKLEILRHNKPVDPNKFKGVYRLRLPQAGADAPPQ